MSGWYKLVGRVPVPAENFDEIAGFYGNPELRRVGATDVGPLWVSTMFLALDHSFGYEGPPILFETMIFGLSDDEYQTRCSTWEEAEAMHRAAVAHAQTLVDAADAVTGPFFAGYERE